MNMQLFAKKSKLLLVGMALSLSSLSLNSNADVSDTLDSLTANATFNYTGGDGKKLAQIGRHAYTFGRIRFSNPTSTVNIVNMTPPSISPPNCNSININLGSFDIISLDEAVSILRRIASEALTYGFGLALQSMCSPCWTAMKTLQNQLERLNLANRNTCTMMRSLIDEGTDDGKLFDLHGKICEGYSRTAGEDSYICGLADTSLGTTVADNWEKFVIAIGADGGDPNAKFLYGNNIAEAFRKVQGTSAIPDAVFPSEISTLLLGTPGVDPVNNPTHTGISVTEAAMNLFGYSHVGPKKDGGTSTSAYRTPLIEDVFVLLSDKLVNCQAGTCRKIMQCQDVSITSSDGVTYNLPCGSHVATSPNYDAIFAVYDAEPLCSDKEAEPTLPEILRCLVQSAYAHIENGTFNNLSDLQQKIIQATPVEVVRAMSLGTIQERKRLQGLMGEDLSFYLAYSLIDTYINDLAKLTTFLLDRAYQEMDMEESLIRPIYEQIDIKVAQSARFKELGQIHLDALEKKREFEAITQKYSDSISRKLANYVSKK